jgi:4-diphosphocytidyl-2-C-methyl-D-erythritol kinase
VAAAPRRGAGRSTPAPALRIRCPAKVNLGLWLLGRRPDGYHEIDTFLQAVSLEDELTLEPGPPGLALHTLGRPIPGPGGSEPNVIQRAWDLLGELGLLPRGAGIRATLTKRIPVGAGLGGGSSDAAGFLAGAERLFDLKLTDLERLALAARLGSDVPFFIRGGIARAMGRGEMVRHLCPIDPYWVVLVSPATAISTTWAYSQVRYPLTADAVKATVLASAIEKRDLGGMVGAMHNAFESVILARLPKIDELKRALASAGAMGALLSGSGSTVFGVAHSLVSAQAVQSAVSGRGAEVRVVRSIEHGITVSRLG